MDHWSILLAYSAYPVILAALAPRIRFYLHKEFRDGEIRLYLPSKMPRIFRRSCTERLRMGAMRQKMAIFKEGNSVCRGPFFSGAFILYSERIDEILNLQLDQVQLEDYSFLSSRRAVQAASLCSGCTSSGSETCPTDVGSPCFTTDELRAWCDSRLLVPQCLAFGLSKRQRGSMGASSS